MLAPCPKFPAELGRVVEGVVVAVGPVPRLPTGVPTTLEAAGVPTGTCGCSSRSLAELADKHRKQRRRKQSIDFVEKGRSLGNSMRGS